MPSEETLSVEAKIDKRYIAWLRRLADILLMLEPVWAIPILAYSYMLTASGVPGPNFLVWVGLSIACIPFILRKLRWGYFSVRTAFEVPAAVFVAGAAIGLIVSIDFSLSLRAFQSLLACVLLYYSFVNYKHPRTLIAFFCVSFFTFWITVPFPAFLQTITVPLNRLESSWIRTLTEWLPQTLRLSVGGEPVIGYDSVYGIGLPIMIFVAILIGVIIFSRKWLLRAASLIFCTVLSITLFVISRAGLDRLLNGITIESRVDLWRDTIYMISRNPIVGLGLGMPKLFTYGSFATTLTHPHNSYLELYANTGLLGAIATAISIIIAIKIAIDIIRSKSSNQWYCFGIGLLLSILAVAFCGVVLTSLSGFIAQYDDGYYYVLSFLPWILAAGLVMVRQILEQDDE